LKKIVVREALKNSSLNSQGTASTKCDFLFPLIPNRLRQLKAASTNAYDASGNEVYESFDTYATDLSHPGVTL